MRVTEEGGSLTELPIVFTENDGALVVNFGILTGREATQAEVDRLARSLHSAGAATELTISAVRRQDYGHSVETVVHQVHVRTNREASAAQVEEICHAWAVSCAEDRRVEPL